jgi:hypothetical protein
VAHGRGRPEVPAAGEGRRRGRTTEVPVASLVVNDAGPSLSLSPRLNDKADMMVVLAPLVLASVTSSFFSTVQTNFDYSCLFAQKIDEERVATWKTNSKRKGTLCSASRSIFGISTF